MPWKGWRLLYRENQEEKVSPSEVSGGITLSLNECRSLFPLLKKQELNLSREQRTIMIKMEKVLYEFLSIQEMEELI